MHVHGGCLVGLLIFRTQLPSMSFSFLTSMHFCASQFSLITKKKSDKTEKKRLSQHPFSCFPYLHFFHPLWWSCQTGVLSSSPNIIDPESKSDRELVSLPLSLSLYQSFIPLAQPYFLLSLPPSLHASASFIKVKELLEKRKEWVTWMLSDFMKGIPSGHSTRVECALQDPTLQKCTYTQMHNVAHSNPVYT